MSEIDTINLQLLESVASKPRYLDLGKSPVGAISRAWNLAERGYVVIEEGWVSITEKGRQAMERNSEHEHTAIGAF
jgi:predicted methyltransferase